MTAPTALVLDDNNTYTLQLVRDLAARGDRVTVFARPEAPALRSRACHEGLIAPPWWDLPAFQAGLLDVVARGFDTMYVCSEAVLESTVPVIGYGRGWGAFPVTEAPHLKITFSKNEALALAESIGVPVPRTIVPASEDEVPGAAERLGYPLLVKGEKGNAARHLHHVHRPEDVLDAYRAILGRETKHRGRPALQERVPGPVYSIGGLFDDGRPLRVLAHRRRLTFPPEGGRTVACVTERPKALLDAAFALFEALRYTGLGHMDFLHDARDGAFRFLEINPRVWGSIGLARLAGIDLYTPYGALARGELVAPDLAYREGVRFHHIARELKFIRRRPGRVWGFLHDCLDPRVHSDFSWRDLRPHLPRRG